jgi:hypothetical protein
VDCLSSFPSGVCDLSEPQHHTSPRLPSIIKLLHFSRLGRIQPFHPPPILPHGSSSCAAFHHIAPSPLRHRIHFHHLPGPARPHLSNPSRWHLSRTTRRRSTWREYLVARASSTPLPRNHLLTLPPQRRLWRRAQGCRFCLSLASPPPARQY